MHMTPSTQRQLNIRSQFARERAAGLAKATGMTVTQVVEEALRAYQPPALPAPFGSLQRAGRILVMKSAGPMVSSADVDQTIDDIRNERG